MASGSPSTYASIIQTLVRRKYVEMDRRRFFPTDTGRVVARFLATHFEPYVDYEFTARMEDTLDEISRGEMHWIPPLMQFWKPFIQPGEGKGRNRQQAGGEADPHSRQGSRHPAKMFPFGSDVMGRTHRSEPLRMRKNHVLPAYAANTVLKPLRLKRRLNYSSYPANLGETAEGEPVSASIRKIRSLTFVMEASSCH